MTGNRKKISTWVHRVIDGPGGLRSFEDHEMAEPTVNRDEAVAAWIIRCLANAKCAGSDYVIDEIIKHRQDGS